MIMITREKFDFITKKYGHQSSWAVWAQEGNTPTSNMGDLSVLDPDKNSRLLEVLNPNVVLVALNFSAGDQPVALDPLFPRPRRPRHQHPMIQVFE